MGKDLTSVLETQEKLVALNATFEHELAPCSFDKFACAKECRYHTRAIMLTIPQSALPLAWVLLDAGLTPEDVAAFAGQIAGADEPRALLALWATRAYLHGELAAVPHAVITYGLSVELWRERGEADTRVATIAEDGALTDFQGLLVRRASGMPPATDPGWISAALEP